MRERTVPLELNCNTAEAALAWAGQQNPGNWIGHSRFVALACKNIAAKCNNMDADQAYCFGLLHDIGRYAGVSSERHRINRYIVGCKCDNLWLHVFVLGELIDIDTPILWHLFVL